MSATRSGTKSAAARGTGVRPERAANAKRIVKPSHEQKAGRAGKPVAKASPARGRRVASLRAMDELMSYAYAIEVEASERYSEFAEAMEAHNNRDVAELFRKLARIEHRHAEQIMENMGWTEPPRPPDGGYRWVGPEGPETAISDSLHYLMTTYHALEIALHNEQRAREFFSSLAKNAASEKVRSEAREMAKEEEEHVRLIEHWLDRTPPPDPWWDRDPDPPRYID